MSRMPQLDVRGRTSVITGAASGMGADVARDLASRRAHLALVDRNADGLAEVAASIALLPQMTRGAEPVVTTQTAEGRYRHHDTHQGLNDSVNPAASPHMGRATG